MFKRLFKLLFGWTSIFVGGLEKGNPHAVLEAEISSFHKAIGEFNTNLAKQAGMIERLKAQVVKGNKQNEMLTAKVTALLNAKETDSAASYALQLKNVKTELGENDEQLQASEELYLTLKKQRDAYVKETQQTIESIKDKITKTEMAEAQAKLAEIASSEIFDTAGAGASLKRMEDGLDDRLHEAKGKERVANESLAGASWAMNESEQKALEAQALAEFATVHGLENPAEPLQDGDTEDAQPGMQKDLGPEETE
ncbi:PspA/IM30 family protein [Planctomycetota bacterium]